jgi:DNA excision repair protein ERCC-3
LGKQEKVMLEGTKDGGVSQTKAMGLGALEAEKKRRAEKESDIMAVDVDAAKLVKSAEGETRKGGLLFSFEIEGKAVEAVRKACRDLEFPILEEYDFRKDSQTPNLPMHLKPKVQLARSKTQFFKRS